MSHLAAFLDADILCAAQMRDVVIDCAAAATGISAASLVFLNTGFLPLIAKRAAVRKSWETGHVGK